jgi:hypothetical protein
LPESIVQPPKVLARRLAIEYSPNSAISWRYRCALLSDLPEIKAALARRAADRAAMGLARAKFLPFAPSNAQGRVEFRRI